ncbi:hypothetical protein GDO78_019648 [Eleutherodactylus coqui]|uniref:Uncharacterized protein n=1 Tax=Eleutherodactylus coqui TaxID=57060 RepID=A0A8J6B9G9_ELECQ|nr:hypothetical protein GDO78_019648 [Eleutherodactylus coqui]
MVGVLVVGPLLTRCWWHRGHGPFLLQAIPVQRQPLCTDVQRPPLDSRAQQLCWPIIPSARTVASDPLMALQMETRHLTSGSLFAPTDYPAVVR